MSSNDKSKLHFSFFSLVLFTLFTYIDGQPSLASRYEAKCEQTSAYLNISYGWRSHFVSIFSLSACSALCGREAECLSLNFCEDWTCTLSDRTLDSTGLQCHEIRSQIRCTYLEKVHSTDDKTCVINENIEQGNTSNEVIFSHTAAGVFHIGDKNYLLQNSGNAHSTRILRNGKELLDVVATNLHVSSNVLCAQSITNFEISRDGGITNVYRIFYNLCTSGKVHKQVWTLGEHVSVSSSVEYHDLVWYLRFPYQPNTYTLSATGIIGNFEDLKTSIQNGAEVFLLKDISFRPLTGVKIEGNTIYTQNIWEISISGTAYQSDAYYFMRTYNSDSLQRHIIRYYVDSDQFRNPTLNFEPSNVYWHVNDAWVLELETDGSGNRLQGCVANLLTKIRGGHRVRIGSQSMYDEATAIWIHNGVIWAQTIDSLSTTANLFDTNPAYRIVRMCSTSGMFYVYKVHIHGGTHSLFEQGVSAMRWFVDKQRWTSVYENGAYINPYTSQLLLDSGQRFKIILKLTDYHLLLNGERIFENESTGVLQLGSYKHFRITIQGNNLLLQLPPEWDIYHASSDGQVDHLTWAYDAAQLKSEDVLTCNMTWFAEK